MTTTATVTFVKDKYLAMLGKEVSVDGIFPVPDGQGGIGFIGPTGKITDVFVNNNGDVVALELEVDGRTTIMNMVNVRSVTLVSKIALVKSGLTL